VDNNRVFKKPFALFALVHIFAPHPPFAVRGGDMDWFTYLGVYFSPIIISFLLDLRFSQNW
jgi:hypothetical protein